jgi:aminopeptidase YwaD
MRVISKQFLLLLLLIFSNSSYGQQLAPDEELLREHVSYLASPQLEGRRTGTAGADKAAQYISEMFDRYSLKPAGDSSKKKLARYLQSFPYIAGVELGSQNRLSFLEKNQSADLQLRKDWIPLAWSTNGKMDNLPVTFVGYGITAVDQGYDDYKSLNVKGHIVLALSGAPKSNTNSPHGRLTPTATLRLKAATAREYGAKALVIVVREEEFGNDRLSRLRYDHSSGDAGIPVIAVSRQVARRWLEASGSQNLEEIQTQLETSSQSEGNIATQNQNSSFTLQNLSLSLQTDLKLINAPATNVIGILEGTDSKLKSEAIVIGAHYDHLGYGGSGSLSMQERAIHHGADDNASGTAGILELARLFSQKENRPRRTLIFIAFSGEEEGLLGSNYFVNHSTFPLVNIIGMINLDMIGRLRERRLTIDGVGTAKEWDEIIAHTNATSDVQVVLNQGASPTLSANSLPIVYGANGEPVVVINRQRFLLTLNQDGFGPSDHASFSSKQIPVLAFWTGVHEDYHKPTDTADKINYTGIVHIISFVSDLLRRVDIKNQRLTRTTPSRDLTERAVGFRVYLGTIPSYADSTDGVKLDMVRDGSPAAKAGLKPGDRVVKLAGRDIRNVYDYTFALSDMKAEQEYEIEIIRGEERLKLKVVPIARK